MVKLKLSSETYENMLPDEYHEMMRETLAVKPYKEKITLKKWNDDEDINTTTPYEVIVVETWYDENNQEITDPIRIAELEELVKAQSQ